MLDLLKSGEWLLAMSGGNAGVLFRQIEVLSVAVAKPRPVPRLLCQPRKEPLQVREPVSHTQVGDHVWLVTFMHYDSGYFDDEACRLEPIENPFGSKVLPMSSE